MDRKYLMIDSTYRDRLLYPNPSEFIIPMNCPVGSNVFNSKNPIVGGYPATNFCFLSNTGQFTGVIVGGNPRAIQVDPSIDTLVGIGVAGNGTTLEQAMDMFTNLILTVAGDANMYRITGYDAVRRIIYISSSLLNFAVGVNYTILNTSTSQSIVLQGYSLSVNGFPVNDDGFFIATSESVYVWDVTIGEFRVGKLTNYSITLDTPFSAAWNVSDEYMVSTINNPQETERFEQIEPGIHCLRSGLWRYSVIHSGTGYTNQMIVRIVTEPDARPEYAIALARVIFTDTTSGISRLELLYCGDQYMNTGEYFALPDGEAFRDGLARIQVIQTAVGFRVNNNSTTMVGSYFMPILLTPEFTYNNTTNSLGITPNHTIPYQPNRRLSHISMVDGNTLNGLTPIVDVLYYKNKKIIMTQSLRSEEYQRFNAVNIGLFSAYNLYFVLPYARDGCVSMDYRGTMVSSNQMVCYAMTVNTLILPNQLLNLPFGSLTSSYPYVLLEVTNETASSGHNKSIIYSNNPNTVSATFVCSISDVNSPLVTKFINISSDRATQIIKFKPNDNLKFRVSMPDGRSFETEMKDYVPPLAANPLLQINCLIEIIRL